MKPEQSQSIVDDRELVVGIVSRIGTDLDPIVTSLTNQLRNYGYDAYEVRVSKIVEYLDTEEKIVEGRFEDRVRSYIKACNEVREKVGNDIFADLSAASITHHRTTPLRQGARARAYIVNQLKHPDEINRLRDIYGDAFVLISCHASYEKRLKNFKTKISLKASFTVDSPDADKKARELFADDEDQSLPFGQNVQSAFPLADVIIDTSSTDLADAGLSRFLRLLFGDPRIAPTFDEYANNLAAQAALRSLDLSRQVGAAIFDSRNKIISLGCNEVPKSTGGTYWDGILPDGRDNQRGFDENTLAKRAMVMELVGKLKKGGLIKKRFADLEESALVTELLDAEEAVLNETKILDILEYGRALHAEMNAITDAARSNTSTQDAILFCTTFPCHNCAKHIVGAGIGKVVYLEPYPKSQVPTMYDDSIAIDGASSVNGLVKFQQYIGVTKSKFYLYSKRRLKNKKGEFLKWTPADAECKLRNRLRDYIDYEAAAISVARTALEERSLISDLDALRLEQGTEKG